jgi:hypothetical protein
MHGNVKVLIRAYIKTFHNKSKTLQQQDINSAAARVTDYLNNAHGHTPPYQLAGLIYQKLLSKMKNKVEHSQRAHALLSASGADRWLNCTPSPRLEENFKNESSSFAEEGTLAHEFAELILKKYLDRIDPKAYKAQFAELSKSKYYSDEMIEFVNLHVDYVLQQFAAAQKLDKHAVLLIEERVDITHLIEGGFGTCDVIIISCGVMEVIDLKYGLGVRVSAEDNSQLKLYGSGAVEKYDVKYDITKVILTVTQPRMDSISSWEILASALIEWGEQVVKPTALIAYEGSGEQKTGTWCRFCKASPRCAAQNALALEAAREAFTDPQLLTDEQLTEVYSKIDAVGKWFSSVQAYMYAEAMGGKKWDGLKLVDGQNRRAWSNEEAARELLAGNYKTEEYTNIKMKGIGEIEKLVGKKNFPIMFVEVLEHKRTSPTLVDESDKRPEMVQEDYFEDLDEEI